MATTTEAPTGAIVSADSHVVEAARTTGCGPMTIPTPPPPGPTRGRSIASTLGHLTPEVREKVVRTNVAKLYNIAIPTAAG